MTSDFGSGEFTMAVNEDAVVDFQRFSVTVIDTTFGLGFGSHSQIHGQKVDLKFKYVTFRR
jgi:hypothetical protein